MSEPAYRRRADVFWRRSLDAVVVLPAGADDVLTLAGTGVAVWELLETWRSIEALTAILAAAEPLDAARISDADRHELAGVVTEEARRLSRLIDNLLDLSRLETGAAEPRREWSSLEEVI